MLCRLSIKCIQKKHKVEEKVATMMEIIWEKLVQMEVFNEENNGFVGVDLGDY